MMRLVKDLPARGFDGFLRGGLPTTDYQGADRDFTNFHHAFLLNVQLIADGKLRMFRFHGFEDESSRQTHERFRLDNFLAFSAEDCEDRRESRYFDEKIHYVHRKHVATLGELLWEFFQLYTSRPFDPKYYRAERDAQSVQPAVKVRVKQTPRLPTGPLYR